jgi:hypothetical protein
MRRLTRVGLVELPSALREVPKEVSKLSIAEVAYYLWLNGSDDDALGNWIKAEKIVLGGNYER